MRNPKHVLRNTILKLFVVMCVAPMLGGQLFAQGSPQIITTSLPNGVVGSSYVAQVLLATGGTQPYVWYVQSGSLPAGLTISNLGTLSGTPLTAGTYNFSIGLADSSSPPQISSKAFTISITATLSITSSTVPNGAVGVSYPATTLTATGGAPPYSWSANSVPPGLSVSSNGVLSGIPAVTGTFDFAVSATDTSSPQQTASKTFTVTFQPRLTITTSSPLPIGIVGVFYTQQLSASGPTSVTWSASSGSLPPGLTLSSGGTIAGTPTVPGSFDFTIQASSTDPVQSFQQAFRMVINPSLTITTNATLSDAALVSPYSVSLAATGGVPPYTWTSQDRLPPGLTLTSSGVISGTPIGLGTLTFTVQVADSLVPPQTSSRTFSLTVASALSISTTSLPSAFQNFAYSQQLQNVGGTAPFTWIVTKGVLPSGLTLTTGGLLQGTPTVLDSQTFDVTVADSRGATSTRTFQLSVGPPIATLSAPSAPATATATQQFSLGVSLDAPRPSALSGQITLAFTSKAEVPVNDPMTQFSTGSRTVSFTIPANNTDAVFSPPVLLLIGTVAGTVRLTASIDNGPSAVPVATIEVLPAPPQVTSLEVLKTPQGLDLIITGYSPPRRVTTIDFNFDIKTSGGKTKRVTLSRNVDSQFASWYQNAASAAFGSAFSLTQSVGIQGSGTVEAVSVTVKNAQGNSSSTPVRPQ